MFFFDRYTFEVSTGSSWFLLGIFSISIYSLPIPIPAGVHAQPGPNPAAHPEPHRAMGQREILWVGSGGTNLKTTNITPAVMPEGCWRLSVPPCPSATQKRGWYPARRDAASLRPGQAPRTLLLKAKYHP